MPGYSVVRPLFAPGWDAQVCGTPHPRDPRADFDPVGSHKPECSWVPQFHLGLISSARPKGTCCNCPQHCCCQTDGVSAKIQRAKVSKGAYLSLSCNAG